MVVGAPFPGIEMTEGRLQAMAAARSLLDSLPYKLEAGMEALKAVTPYDHNKNSINDVKDNSRLSSSHPPASTSHLQPFTAPWLAEVARITPARPEHLPFVHPTPSAHVSTSLPDYYPHFPNLPPRSTYYNHPIFSAPHPYLRDFPPRPPVRPYPLIDPRHAGDLPNTRSPPNPSHVLPHVRPLGPPPPPPPLPVPEVRDSRLENAETLHFHRNSIGEPIPKRRYTSAHSSSVQFSPPRGSPLRNYHKPCLPSESHKTTPPDLRPSTSGGRSSNRPSPKVSNSESSPNSENLSPRPPGPYYPHFQKGALVAIGEKVRRVEDMRTEDFVEAANAAEDLTLDPPSVSSIVMASSGDTATVVFNFASRKEEMSVEPTVDHPFFVLNFGWSSCSPQRTLEKYGLTVRQLQVGDLCVSLTETAAKQKPPPPRPVVPQQPQVTVDSSMPPPSSFPIHSPQHKSAPTSAFSEQSVAAVATNEEALDCTNTGIINKRQSPVLDTVGIPRKASPQINSPKGQYPKSPLSNKSTTSTSTEKSTQESVNAIESHIDSNISPINLSKSPSSPNDRRSNIQQAKPIIHEETLPIETKSFSPSDSNSLTSDSQPTNNAASKNSSAIPTTTDEAPSKNKNPTQENGSNSSNSPVTKSPEHKSQACSPVTTTLASSNTSSPTIWRPGVSQGDTSSTAAISDDIKKNE